MQKRLFKKEISSLKKYLAKQDKNIKSDQKKQFTFFVLGFIFFYLLLTFLITPIEPFAKEFTSSSSAVLLSMQGVEISESDFYTADDGEIVYSFFVGSDQKSQIIISSLCTGVLEIIILICAMLASFGITLNKKLIGIVVAIFSGIIFNIVRVFVTINIILIANPEVVEFAHDLLFRVILLLYIMVVYVAWFYWSEKTSST